MGDLIANILDLIEHLKFWKKKKNRRKFEKENNLPKKLMFQPLTLILFTLLIVLIVFRLLKYIS